MGTRKDYSNYRRFTYFVDRDQKNRTFIERIGDADFSSLGDLKKAFSVEKVTDEFYKDYRKIFDDLQNDLKNQIGDKRWAHDYALQFLNRVMFLYFIQKKGWLGTDRKFLLSFWNAYHEAAVRKTPFSLSGWASSFLTHLTREKTVCSSTRIKGSISPKNIATYFLKRPI